MASPYVGGARAAIGQGLGMGWGDEAEAWLRSKAGEGRYEDILKRIRGEYAEYAKEYPTSQTLLEFAGGAAPAVASLAIPGAQGAAPATVARTAGALSKLAASPLARSIAAGTITGGISGAGSAVEGERGAGAGSGAAMGAALGAAAPLAMRGLTGGLSWAKNRLLPSEASIQELASAKMNQALQRSGMTPADIQAKIASDRALGVPSVIANVSPKMAKLAETMAQRPGEGSELIGNMLEKQRGGSRERVQQQVASLISPKNYFDENAQLITNLRAKAGNLYDTAYAHGSVDDPRIMNALKDPEFRKFYQQGKEIADTEARAAKLRGDDPAKYQLKEIYDTTVDPRTSVISFDVRTLPDVRTLDYIKKGIDREIEKGYTSGGIGATQAGALKALKREFVNAIDENVPAYAAARKGYAGDKEVVDALDMGMKDFNRMTHEQVTKTIANMSDAEREAFRTGAARSLYGVIMNPSGNINAGQRIIGSPEMQAKLQPLFENAGQFNLFKSALERESQLVAQAQKITGNSATASRLLENAEFEKSSPMANAAASFVSGGASGSLTNLALQFLRSGQVHEDTADKLSKMLMSKDPNEVAAVVQLLEKQAAGAGPRTARANVAELDTTTGTVAAVQPAPVNPASSISDIETKDAPEVKIVGPSIEDDILNEK